jgi:hypothetical protein
MAPLHPSRRAPFYYALISVPIAVTDFLLRNSLSATISEVTASQMRQHTPYYPQPGSRRVQNDQPKLSHLDSTVPVTPPRVAFYFCRPAREDEEYVMKSFASHARHCRRCDCLCRTYSADDTLCKLGLARARDVTQYIYYKAGQLFSCTGDHVQVELPYGCEAVSGLLRAIGQGLMVRGNNDGMGLAASQRHDRPVAGQTASTMERRSDAKNLEKLRYTEGRDEANYGRHITEQTRRSEAKMPSRQNRGTREAYHERRRDDGRRGSILLWIILGSLLIA